MLLLLVVVVPVVAVVVVIVICFLGEVDVRVINSENMFLNNVAKQK